MTAYLERSRTADWGGDAAKHFEHVDPPRRDAITVESQIPTARRPRVAGRAEQVEVAGSVTKLIPALRGFARSITRDVNQADDLVQDTLVRAIANIDQFTPGTNLKAWLFTILRNTHISASKRQTRERNLISPLNSEEIGVGPPQPWLAAKSALFTALDKLPSDQRQALVLIGALGLSYDECAEICNCPIGTVKSRLNRARARICVLLNAETADAV